AFPEEAADQGAVKELRHRTHKTIKKVTEDLERFRFNTMLASLMEFTNHLGKVLAARSVNSSAWREAIDTLLLLLAPTAPHLAEELWTRTGHPYSIHNQSLPPWKEDLAAEEQITLVIQVNGKLRDKVIVPVSITEGEAQELALSQPRVQAHLKGREVTKIIYVPQRLVNLVVR
ncbi:MAG: leucine--tRNA ligase, partial [Dehalococcoidia bacterium]